VRTGRGSEVQAARRVPAAPDPSAAEAVSKVVVPQHNQLFWLPGSKAQSSLQKSDDAKSEL